MIPKLSRTPMNSRISVQTQSEWESIEQGFGNGCSTDHRRQQDSQTRREWESRKEGSSNYLLLQCIHCQQFPNDMKFRSEKTLSTVCFLFLFILLYCRFHTHCFRTVGAGKGNWVQIVKFACIVKRWFGVCSRHTPTETLF